MCAETYDDHNGPKRRIKLLGSLAVEQLSVTMTSKVLVLAALLSTFRMLGCLGVNMSTPMLVQITDGVSQLVHVNVVQQFER